MKVYVIEKVTYGYYRFGDIIGVALSEESAIKVIKNYHENNPWTENYDIVIKHYDIIVENNGDDTLESDEREEAYFKISVFEVNE